MKRAQELTPEQVRSPAFRRKFVSLERSSTTNFRLKAGLRTYVVRLVADAPWLRFRRRPLRRFFQLTPNFQLGDNKPAEDR